MFKKLFRLALICSSLLLVSCGLKGPLEYPSLAQLDQTPTFNVSQETPLRV